jgi:hypothetical protein
VVRRDWQAVGRTSQRAHDSAAWVVFIWHVYPHTN